MSVIYFSPMSGWTPKKVKRVRQAAGMTQAQLAEWVGVTRMHISHLEQGIRPPGAQTVRLLCVLLDRTKNGAVKSVLEKESEKRRETHL